MRNLKRVLALAMAMIMMLGMMVIGTSAASYKDAETIDANYAEAIDVLTGLGVFKGQSTTESVFAPKAVLTRAEAAALIYRVITGDVADKQVQNYDYASLKDVQAGKWFTGYVTYANNGGYIKGDENGNFNPNASVTGVQVIAIMLRAAGYGQNGEYEGKAWKDNILTDAMELGVTKGISTATLNAPATRELVAQLIFNAMTKVNMVTYTPILGYIPVKLATLSGVQTLSDKVFALGCAEGYVTYGGAKAGMILTDTETKIAITTAQQDIFDAGRYGHVWTSGTKAVTDVYYDDTVLATKYDGAGFSAWTTKTNANFVGADSVSTWVYNGKVLTTAAEITAAKNAAAKVGVEVQLIDVDGKGAIDTVIVMEQKVATLLAAPSIKNNSIKIFGTENFNLTTATAAGYEDLAAGDVVLYVKMEDGVTYFEVAGAVEGQKTYYYNGAKGEYMTFAGEKYVESELEGATDDAALFGTTKKTFEVNAFVWVDRGGNVIATEIPGVNGIYAMVIDAYCTISADHRTTEYYVNMLGTDGEETGYVQVKTPAEANRRFFEYAIDRDDEFNGLGTLVTYTIAANGQYELTFIDEANTGLADDYKQGGAYMALYDNNSVEEFAVTKSTVVFYYYTITIEEDNTGRETTKVYYGVNTGKGNIPAYAEYSSVPYAVANNEVLNVAVINEAADHAYTDYAYIISFDGQGTDKNREAIFYYTGVLSDGTVKEFITPVPAPYAVGEVVAFYVNEEGMADFSPSMTFYASVREVADGDTAYVQLEGYVGGRDFRTGYYVNVEDVFDLTNTRGLKDGDTVDNFTLLNREVRAVIVPNAKWDGTLVGLENIALLLETVFVIDEDVVYGQFEVDGYDYWYPVSTYWPTATKIGYTLDDLADGYTGKYHINDSEKAYDAEKDVYYFEDEGVYTTVEHEDPAAITVTANVGTLSADKKTLTVPYGTTLSTALVTAEDCMVGYNDKKLTITSTADCGCETKLVIEVKVAAEVGTETIEKAWDADKKIYAVNADEILGYAHIENAVLADNIYELTLSQIVDLTVATADGFTATQIEYAVFTSTADAANTGYALGCYHGFGAGNVISTINDVVKSGDILIVMVSDGTTNYFTAFAVK